MHAQEKHLSGMIASANRLAHKASLHPIPQRHLGPRNVILRKDGEPLVMKTMHYANSAQCLRDDHPTKLVHIYRGMSNVIVKERRSHLRMIDRVRDGYEAKTDADKIGDAKALKLAKIKRARKAAARARARE